MDDDNANRESPTDAGDADDMRPMATAAALESEELPDSNSTTTADQESDVVSALNAVSIVEEDFLATIPMPDTMTSGFGIPEVLVPKKAKKRPPPPPPPPPPAPLAPSSPPVCDVPNLIETEEKVASVRNSNNSPSNLPTSMTSASPDGREKRLVSRWDRSVVLPKPRVWTSSAGGVTKTPITAAFEKPLPSKTSPTSPTVVVTRGVKPSITFARNLGFRTSYQGVALLLGSQSANSNDADSEYYSGATENGTGSGAVSATEEEKESAIRGIGVFGPGITTTVEKDVMQPESGDKIENEAENAGDDVECSSNQKEDEEFEKKHTTYFEQPVSVAPNQEFRKFKFQFGNRTCTARKCEDGGQLPLASSVSTVCSSVFEDSNSCGATMPTPTSAANSETDVSTPTDSQSESSSRDLFGEGSRSPSRHGRRRKGSPYGRRRERSREDRRRSSRIRFTEARRERERYRDDTDETMSRRRRRRRERNESLDAYSSDADTSDTLLRPAVCRGRDRNVLEPESKNTEVDSLANTSIPLETIECILAPHLIPLPPMPPPPWAVPFSLPPATVASPSFTSLQHHNSSSPVCVGDDLSGGKPEKVKSRWRRNSELERVCTVLPPSFPPVPSFVPPNMLPDPRNHGYEFGAKLLSQQQRFPNNVAPPGSYYDPSSFAPPRFADCVAPVNKTSNSHSIAPVIKGPPPPPPPVCGFFDEGEVTEDWSEKEVTSSLTKHPLPLRPRVVNHVLATKEADSPELVASKPKSSNVAAVVPVQKVEKPPYMNFEEITENVYLSERRRSKSKREVRRMLCDCTITKDEVEQGFVACGDDCLNRLLMMECGSRCPTGEYCTNRRFQKKEYAKIEAFKTEKKGWGVKTSEDLPSGSFVLEYVGEVLDQREFKKRVKEYAHDRHRHYYFMALRADEIIDATQKGSLSRFINHSCDPNCETQKWTVNGELRVGFFTRRSILSGDELTFDYQFQRYGKEAQKCFCEAPNCRGFIGGDKQTPLKKDRRDVKKKKVAEDRRRDDLEDMDLEEEIEKINHLGGLKNRAQILNLCRLMVRAEDTDFRFVLLHSLQKTTEQACLRLFLDYHGLSLLWSWMVDIGNGDDMLPLKFEILKSLQKLPVSNKNVLTDSKVMPIVQRWAAQIAEYTASQKAKGDSVADGYSMPAVSRENGLTPAEDSSSDNDCIESKETVAVDAKEITAVSVADDESVPVLSNSIETVDETEANNEDERLPAEEDDKLPSVPETMDTKESDKENEEDMSIEEKIMQMEGDSDISLERKNGRGSSPSNTDPCIVKAEIGVVDTAGGRTSPPLPPHSEEKLDTVCEAGEIANLASELLSTWENLKEVYRIPKREQNQNRREHEREADEQESGEKDRDHDRRERLWDRDRDGDGRHRYDDRHRSNNDYDRGMRSKSGRDSPPERDRRGKRDRWRWDDDEPEKKRPGGLPAASNNLSKLQRRREFELKVQQEEEEALRRQHEEYYRQQQEAQMMAVDPMYFDPNYCPIPPPGSHVPYFDPATGYPIPAVPIAVQDPMAIIGAIAPPDSAVPVVVEDGTPVGVVAASSPSTNVSTVPAQMVYPVYPPGVAAPVASGYIAPTPQQGAAPHFVSPQGQPLYYPPQGVVVQLPDQQGSWNDTVPNVVSEEPSSPPPEPPKSVQPAKLPAGWKTAKDAEGNVYYYHTVTRETQWEPPVTEDAGLELETPALGEQKKKKGTTTAAADTSSELSRRIKEFFRSKMSQFIVQCLNPYRKPDCKLGRISSTDEFKHLARKLTHFVMAKELKHCRNVEDLECNENVKHKAKDFVRKYMAKFGPIYKKAASPKDEDEEDD